MSNSTGGYDNGLSGYSMGDGGTQNYGDFYQTNEGNTLGGNDDDPNDDFDPLELLNSPLFDEKRHSRANSDDDVGDYSEYPSEQQQQQRQDDYPSQPASMPNPASSVPPPIYHAPNLYGAQAGSTSSGNSMGGYPQQYGGMQSNIQAQNQNMQQNMQQSNNYGGGMHGGMNLPMQGMMQGMPGGMQGNYSPNPNPNMQAGGGQFPSPTNNMQGGGNQYPSPSSNIQGQMGSMNHVTNHDVSMNNAMNNLNESLNGLNVTGMNHNNPNSYSSMNASMPNMQGSFQGRPHMGNGGGSLPASPMPSVAQLSASLHRGGGSLRTGRNRPTPRVDANGRVIPNTSQDPSVNEAMEKLCESMRRSAMSRNLVKQLSGKSPTRSGSGKSLSRSNSGVGMRKQVSGRSLSGNLGGLADDGSGRGGTPTRVAPIRRLSETKYRLQGRMSPGNRAAFRQNSMGSQSSAASGVRSAPKTFLQLDDQSFGDL